MSRKSREDELLDELQEKTQSGRANQEDLKMIEFLEDFQNLTPLGQYEKYIQTTNFDNETEKGKEVNYLGRALVMPVEKVRDYVKTLKVKQIDVWDDVDIVLSVAEHFEVPPAIARYRIMEVVVYLHKVDGLNV